MTQKGTVIKIDEEKALIAVPRPSACGENCAACSGGCGSRGHLAWVHNPIGAKEGDRVLLTSKTDSVLLGSLLIYLLPLILFFMGYGVTYALSEKTSWAILVSLLCLVVSFLFLHLFDKKIAPKIQMVKILNPDGSGKDEENGI